ncbi:nuclear transport factor 2 family protein [Brachybacterium kimchii]|uniref:Nuclear transport factor 2 family protein n=1 Tax=Brachybacterium kimchii TaxID=2942909 RepID=A0ABY4N232_9MICO|nr:nuclear transport factor 2 family protein [Brachybacterium kimchii]UQN28611.1 nuclear transport factor 2 family protein [Brachybacterium kimchii]
MTDTIPEPVASFLEAVMARDTTAFTQAFTANPTVDDWGKVLTGFDEIHAWSDKEFIGSAPTLAITSVTTAGDSVTVVGDWRSRHANGPSSFRFDLEGDKIATMTIREG